jgi:iron complex outermembrane receptor protein
VATYLDGVYVAAAQGGIFNIADLERIEVLRGPQGTLFGRNVTGGAVSFTTRDPTGRFGVKQTFTLGNYNQFRSSTRVDLPQMGAFSAAFTYAHTQRDGDIKNLGAGATWDLSSAYGRPHTLTSPKRLGDSNNEAFLAAIKGDFGDLKATYHFDYSEEDFTASGVGLAYLAPPVRGLYSVQPDPSILTQVTRERPKAVNNWATTPGHDKNYGHNLTLSYRVNDHVSVKNIAAYRYSYVNSGINDIFGIGGLRYPDPASSAAAAAAANWYRTVLATRVNAGAVIPPGSPIIYSDSSVIGRIKQWSDEFQVNLDTKLATVTAGGLIYKQHSDLGYLGAVTGAGLLRNGALILPGFQLPSTVQAGNGGGRPSFVNGWSKAVYAQGEFHVAPGLDLVGGVRYTKDRKKGTDNTAVSAAFPLATFPVDYKDDEFTYTAGVNYKPTSDVLLYGKYVTGFISGGELGSVTYDPEKAKSFEAGVKADWLDHTLRTNLALYHVNYNGLQLNSSPRVSPLYATQLALGVTQLLLNTGNARVQGAELETTFTPTRALMFQANLSYMDFKQTKLLPGIATGQREVFGQLRPKYTAQLAAQWTSDPVYGDAHLTARIDGDWRSKEYLTNAFAAASVANAGLVADPAAVYNDAEYAAYKKAETSGARWLVNARLALEDISVAGKTASVALWGRNIFNDKSASYSFSGVTASPIIYEAARTYGVDVSFEF